MAQILSGKEVAREILKSVKERVQKSCGQPGLTVVQVGNNTASSIYVSREEKRATRLGFRSDKIVLDEDIEQEKLMELIQGLNENPQVHGILVQLPLPKHLDDAAILEAIDPSKDVDGFHAVNTGLLFQGRGGFVPCTPKGVMHILRYYQIALEGKHAVVVGRSNIVGRPMVALLEQSNCTVTLCHSRTSDLPMHLSQADIVVAAVGRPKMIKGEWLKEGVVVIDVGINSLEDGTICGDVDFDSAEQIASAITPVPGGVGPMTIASLMENTFFAYQKSELN